MRAVKIIVFLGIVGATFLLIPVIALAWSVVCGAFGMF